jgi:CSLREA domain-containing protein
MMRKRFSVLVRFVLAALSLVILTGQSFKQVQAAPGSTFVVNTTADTVDADVGAPACADANGLCSLRAAIMQANFTAGADTITLPAGVYLLTRPGNDDADVLGDLDISDDLTIQGAGSATTIVDGNGSVTGDRVFQILATAKNITISGLTIRNGKRVATFDEGGGLYWDGNGSHLSFSNVVVTGNAAYYGGGLYLNYSNSSDVVNLDHVVVHDNTAATAAAGGLGVNFGEFATFDLNNSQVYSNTAYEGGGVYFQTGSPLSFGLASVRIENSEIYANNASLSAGFENHSGDASVPVVLLNDHIHNNQASNYGGAIGNYGALSIQSSTLEANSATTRGGGIYDYEGGQIDIQKSTLSGNTSASGGGIFSELFIHNAAKLALTDTTLSGNGATENGGGIYAQGGDIKIYNSTIASNQAVVPLGSTAGHGGGILVIAPATIDAQNMILADNTHRIGAGLPIQDDCNGSINSLGYNLVESIAGCVFSGTVVGVITGSDPMLGPLMLNGGTQKTQVLESGSPAIDAGETPTCLDPNGAAISSDERGFRRPIGPRCDIGAVEYSPYAAYVSLVRK